MNYWQTDNGVLVSGPHQARVSPADAAAGRAVYLYPSGAVTTAPPDVGAQQAAVWRDGAWQVVPDHRGETWWRGPDAPVVIDALGDPREDGLAATQPRRPATPDDVRGEAARRIEQRYPVHKQLNILRANSAGEQVAMGRWIDAIRAASNAMEPSPPDDYADDRHWPSVAILS